MKRTRLRPISDKQRAKNAARGAQARAEAAAFKDATRGLPCVACGRTEREAYENTGYGIQAHHAIRQEVLKRLHMESLLWRPELALPVCEYPCHLLHTRRSKRILWSQLPDSVVVFCAQHGLFLELQKEYPE